MRVRVDQGADAVDLTLAETAVKERGSIRRHRSGLRFRGRIVVIEILDASKGAGSPAALKDFSFELPGVA